MFSQPESSSTVSIVLPPRMMLRVANAVAERDGAAGLLWRGRGSLVHEHWLKAWLPPISPAKTMMQLLMPNAEVEGFVREVIELTNLDHQALGAVFSVSSDQTWFGADFPRWPTEASGATASPADSLEENLHALYCVVSHKFSDRVCKAAIDAGAHGPIVSYAEGRGLRDRLGWLRITKDHEKEVLTVLCDDDSLETVFSAMASAGNLHLPGRGFLYHTVLERGLFNLPSRAVPRHQEASLQQIVTAIDKLQGNSHWRDHSVSQVGNRGQSIGIDRSERTAAMDDHFRLSVTVLEPQSAALTDLLLDRGAPGLTIGRARLVGADGDAVSADTHLSSECLMVSAVASADVMTELCAALEQDAESQGVTHCCASIVPVPHIATYQPGRIDYRQSA